MWEWGNVGRAAWAFRDGRAAAVGLKAGAMWECGNVGMWECGKGCVGIPGWKGRRPAVGAFTPGRKGRRFLLVLSPRDGRAPGSCWCFHPWDKRAADFRLVLSHRDGRPPGAGWRFCPGMEGLPGAGWRFRPETEGFRRGRLQRKTPFRLWTGKGALTKLHETLALLQ
jgi:hypothetical protein